MDIAELNGTLVSEAPRREELVANRTAESEINAATIADAEESAAAVDAAIVVLEDYFKNLTSAFVQIHEQARAGNSSKNASTALPDILAKEPAAANPLVAEGKGIVSMLEVVRDDFKLLAEETRTKETEAADLHTEMLRDYDVMMAASQRDYENKQSEQARLEDELASMREDHNASLQNLDDAEKAYEALKPPCLNQESYEEKEAKRETEIAALQEALEMLDAFAESGGAAAASAASAASAAALLQQQKKRLHLAGSVANSSAKAASTLAAVAKKAIVNATAQSRSSNATEDAEKVSMIATILADIRTEVAVDLLADAKVNTEVVTWCESTISSKQAAIADAHQREQDLLVEIETSAQQKAQLEVELERLAKEHATDSQSLEQARELRQRSAAEFHENEKEMIESIQSLTNALVVLDKHFNASASESTDYASQRAEIEASKPADSAAGGAGSLMSVASAVKQALHALPGGEAALASVMDVADFDSLHNFLSKPDSIDLSMATAGRRSSASLMARDTKVASSADGEAIFGILQQLLETFKADLAAAREKEAQQAADFEELSNSKKAQIDAHSTTTTSKQDQLAYYTTVNAQAKEDMAYNTAARQADTKYLQQVQSQCIDSAHEYKIRKQTRQDEMAAIDEAIGILTAGEGVETVCIGCEMHGECLTTILDEQTCVGDGGTWNEQPPGAASFMLHTAQGTGRVFLRSRGASNATVPPRYLAMQNASHQQVVNTAAKARGAAAAAVSTAPPAPAASVVEAYLHHSQETAPAAEKAAAAGQRAGERLEALARQQKAMDAALKKLKETRVKQVAISPHNQHAAASADEELDVELATPKTWNAGKRLAILATAVRVKAAPAPELAALSIKRTAAETVQILSSTSNLGPLTGEALGTVVRKIDELSSTLKEQKAMEIKMRDTCVSEKNQAEQQHERRLTDESKLNTTIEQLESHISLMLQEVNDTRGQIEELNSTLAQAKVTRVEEHDDFRATVMEQEAHQAKLQEAIQALKVFYGKKPPAAGASLAQVPPKAAFLAVAVVKAPAKDVAPELKVLKAPTARPPTGLLVRSLSKNETEEPLPERQRNRVNTSTYEAGPPSTFSKPLAGHQGTKGIISILELLVDDSENLVEAIVREETASRDGMMATTTNTQKSLEEKDHQVVVLNQKIGAAEAKLQEEQESLAAVQAEMEEIQAFVKVVEEKCSYLVENFASSQEARTQEIDNLAQAKASLLGMIQS
eukprot:TRINITY_DN16462_c0_g1_i2.p1 TRINITY_DN16462_c0_g1~~TRINITY_DN16462_c0_g1_i2.p1  ORF type:complete len:1230 (+),score=488.72 TRINITY_DN16462_c0_g1_i2:526-4215(+)